jgi:hypothetical protein
MQAKIRLQQISTFLPKTLQNKNQKGFIHYPFDQNLHFAMELLIHFNNIIIVNSTPLTLQILSSEVLLMYAKNMIDLNCMNHD